MRVGGRAGQADDRTTRVGTPVRREQTGERGHEVDAAVVLDLTREGFALGRTTDDAELVAQPLHGRTGDRDRTFQRLDDLIHADLPRRPGQPVTAMRATGAHHQPRLPQSRDHLLQVCQRQPLGIGDRLQAGGMLW